MFEKFFNKFLNDFERSDLKNVLNYKSRSAFGLKINQKSY